MSINEKGNRKHSCECVGAVAMLPDEELMFELADFFKLFGDSTRIRILTALDRTELCVCEISELLSMTKSAVSHQLKLLRQSNLVKCERRGKHIYYALADSHVRDIIEKALEHIAEEN